MTTFLYAPLLQPLQIGKLTIPNRFCAGPLTLPSVHGPFGEFSQDGLAYYEARAKGGFGLIFTGAFHPDTLVDPVHPLDSKQPLKAPKAFQRSAVELLERLDAYGTKMIPQISMGYGRNAPGCFCPSEIPYYHDPARLAPALTKDQIRQKIDQMIATAVFFQQCGFPGIEVHAMHWGYLLDQFAMTFMNHRTDEYGGALENRLRCAREILEGIKAACGSGFVVSMRLALKSYIKGYNQPSLHGEDEVGRTLEEGLEIARRLEAYGYDCLSVDFGQYDSFYYAAPPCYMEKGRVIPLSAAVKEQVKIPILCGGRMNDPALAAQAIAEGKMDGVVLGRASLADPDFPRKVAMGCPQEIRPCIGCNQACLDQIFAGKITSCLVNPRACHETEMVSVPARTPKKLAVVGAGPAGLSFAVNAAQRGHVVTLFDASAEIGGQFNIAKQIPGKEEFYETLRYFRRMLAVTGVTLALNTRVDAAMLAAFDEVALATGIVPRVPDIDGIDHSSVLTYLDVLRDKAPVGERVAIIGCGGIGFDTAMYLSQPGEATSQNIAEFCVEWGIDTSLNAPGGLRPEGPVLPKSPRQIVMLQRRAGKPGDGLGKTTGWIHRATLLARGVKMIPAVSYQRIDDRGLHVLINGEPQVLEVDNVIICAGQEPQQALAVPLRAMGKPVHLIGGCDVALELDARRAIAQGTQLALEI